MSTTSEAKSTLVTGANGFVGRRLVKNLLENGCRVSAFVQSARDTKIPSHRNLVLFEGDVLNRSSMELAVRGCETVFHLASLVGIWSKQPERFDEVNVRGTELLLEACLQSSVRRVLVCSSCGIFGSAKNGEWIKETKPVHLQELGPYERSKYRQVEVALKFADRGLEIVIVYPTRIFGPGPRNEAHSLTRMMERVAKGNRCFIPGNGKCIANYVFVDDVAKGIQLAMNHGQSGQGYILGGNNMSYDQLFEAVQSVSRIRRRKTWHVPIGALNFVASVEALRSRLFGVRPLITFHAVRKYTSNTPVSIQKILQELGYCPTDLKAAIRMTLFPKE